MKKKLLLAVLLAVITVFALTFPVKAVTSKGESGMAEPGPGGPGQPVFSCLCPSFPKECGCK